MARSLAEIERELLELPERERAVLARDLLATLDKGQGDEVEELWAREAERRYREYRKGNVGATSAEEAFAEVRRGLK